MNTVLTKRFFVWFAQISAVVVLMAACDKGDVGDDGVSQLKMMKASRPAKIANAYVYEGGRCPVDSSMPPTSAGHISVSRKAQLTLNGWVLPATVSRQLPPLVFAILAGEKSSFYFEGGRVSRPDVVAANGGNRVVEMAGFKIVSELTEIPAGLYKLNIATGTEFVVDICRTNISIQVTE